MSWAQAEAPWGPQVDLLYLHNAAEAQGAAGETELLHRLHDAFVWLEHARQDGSIRAYGMATWSCFRSGLACSCHDAMDAASPSGRVLVFLACSGSGAGPVHVRACHWPCTCLHSLSARTIAASELLAPLWPPCSTRDLSFDCPSHAAA